MNPLFDLSMKQQSLNAADYTNQLWDFVIIGAGPAGALAAFLLAERNRVLLIDKADFPREKTCGGCLSRRALSELERAGLRSMITSLGGKPLNSFYIASGGVSTQISIPQALSVSRKKLDATLILAAKQKGAVFLSGTQGFMNPAKNDFVWITLIQGQQESRVRAKMVLICDGLQGTSLKNLSGMTAHIAPNSLIGISTTCHSSGFAEQSNAISMACGPQGYVGMATQEDEKLEIAAAVHPSALKIAGSPSVLVEKILWEAGFKIPAGLSKAKWLGSPSLMRHRTVLAGDRFFVFGDASGFVEPFTGEGIYWALLQANEIVSLLEEHHFEWGEPLRDLWQLKSRTLLNKRWRTCKIVSLSLRIPWLCRLTIALVNAFPQLGIKLAQIIHGGSS